MSLPVRTRINLNRRHSVDVIRKNMAQKNLLLQNDEENQRSKTQSKSSKPDNVKKCSDVFDDRNKLRNMTRNKKFSNSEAK